MPRRLPVDGLSRAVAAAALVAFLASGAGHVPCCVQNWKDSLKAWDREIGEALAKRKEAEGAKDAKDDAGTGQDKR